MAVQDPSGHEGNLEGDPLPEGVVMGQEGTALSFFKKNK